MKELDKVTSDIEKSEIDELVDYDGTMNNSKVPILDPMTTTYGLSTMDKRVAAVTKHRPLTRGYRVYYGESVVKEEDMWHGFDETKFMNAEDTIDYFVDELDFDERDGKIGKI